MSDDLMDAVRVRYELLADLGDNWAFVMLALPGG